MSNVKPVDKKRAREAAPALAVERAATTTAKAARGGAAAEGKPAVHAARAIKAKPLAKQPVAKPRALAAVGYPREPHAVMRGAPAREFEGRSIGPGHPTPHATVEHRSDVTVVRGTERLGEVSAEANTNPPCTNLLQGYPSGCRLNPKQFGVALPLIAQNYGKFRFLRVELEYVPVITTNTPESAGSMYLAFQPDPDQPSPPRSDAGVNAVATWGTNKKPGSWIAPLKFHVQFDMATQAELFIDSSDEQRFDEQGVVYCFNAEATPSATIPYGQLYIHYTVELSLRNLPAPVFPAVFVKNAHVPNGASGSAVFAGAEWYGSTDALVQLATPVGAGVQAKQFMLTGPQAGGTTTKEKWAIHAVCYLDDGNVGGASVVTPMEISVDSTDGASSGWPSLQDWGAYNNAKTAYAGRLANGFHLYGGNPAVFPPASHVIDQHLWLIETDRPVLVGFVAPALSVAATSRFIIHFYKTGVWEPVARSTPNALITVSQFRDFERLVSEAIANQKVLVGALNNMVDEVDRGVLRATAEDMDMLALCHKALGSNKPSATTTMPMFLPLLASAAGWLLAKFGPTLMSSVLHIGAQKLEKYAGGSEETPTRPISAKRSRRRRRRRAYEDEEDEEDEE